MPPIQPGIPLDFYLPGINELISGAYKAGIAQVPLTLTNAVLATSLLASDLFKEKISNKKLSITIGATNVIVTPLSAASPCATAPAAWRPTTGSAPGPAGPIS